MCRYVILKAVHAAITEAVGHQSLASGCKSWWWLIHFGASLLGELHMPSQRSLREAVSLVAHSDGSRAT
jgi:hypothetical protein